MMEWRRGSGAAGAALPLPGAEKGGFGIWGLKDFFGNVGAANKRWWCPRTSSSPLLVLPSGPDIGMPGYEGGRWLPPPLAPGPDPELEPVPEIPANCSDRAASAM